MEREIKERLNNRIFLAIRDVSRKRRESIYLVGGYIRDWWLNRESIDYDFCVKGKCLEFSRYVAKILSGNFVLLDKENETSRVICKIGKQVIELDFTKLKAKDIVSDLRLRDFTINSIAIDLNSFKIIDPLGGLEDLKAKIIRTVSDKVLADDPLRMLRAVRLSCELDFKITSSTWNYILKHSQLIKDVARERITNELFLILSHKNSYRYIIYLHKLGLLGKIIPEVKKDSLRHLKWLEDIIDNIEQFGAYSLPIRGYLEEIAGSNHTRLANLKLISFLYPLGVSKIEEIYRNLKLSGAEIRLMRSVVRNFSLPEELSALQVVPSKKQNSFFRKAGDEVFSILILFLANSENKAIFTERYQFVKEMIKGYFNLPKISPPLLKGKDLIENFGLKEGPIIGHLLKKVNRTFIEGEIDTKEEGLEMVKRLLKD
ncbi:MAG: hypothetical protein QME40_03855 [bacterium]|nr:hypothetical protein [bacterium]